MFPVAPPVEGRDWLSGPPTPWPDFRGRVVVVLFWSFGCEASLLAMRRLTEAAEGWPSGVAVLAVHTPRFPYEDDVERVRHAMARHRIALPVIHDPDYITWNRYNPGGWPATAVIDKRGRVVGIDGGTTGIDVIAEAVAVELAKPDPKHRRSTDTDTDTARRTTGSEEPTGADGGHRRSASTMAESSLRFPSAVAATASGLLVVADSGNDRLLVGELDPDLRTFRPQVEITDVDDPIAVACAAESVIYVVERGTGSVLQVDLEYGTLDVLADELAALIVLLVDDDGSVVVADAGSDRLIRIAGGPDGDVVMGPIAGSGLSGSLDGDAGRAELAQPAGLARTGAGLAFCDAASSNLRLLTDAGRVVTITGNDFFDWGLVDGPAHQARLQRPTGLCATPDGSVLIADTGNDRIRMLSNRRIRTLGLSGLNQPTALTMLASGHIVIADTGNHRLVVADPARSTGWPLAVYPAMMTSVWDTASPGRPRP